MLADKPGRRLEWKKNIKKKKRRQSRRVKYSATPKLKQTSKMIYDKDDSRNCEVIIDYVNKSVNFNAVEGRPENFSFFSHNIVQLLWGVLAYIFLGMYFYYYRYVHGIYVLPLILIYIIVAASLYVILGYVSIFLHRTFPWLKKIYPESNGWIFSFKKEKRLDLSKDKYSKRHIVEGNKLYVLDYHIAFFQYWYIGTNFIERVETKYIHNKGMQYIAIFIFKNVIEDGIFYYK